MHLFPDMASQTLLHHTRYNQYDSMVRPLIKWLTDRGVQYVGKTRVTDIDIGNDTEGEFTAPGSRWSRTERKGRLKSGRRTS